MKDEIERKFLVKEDWQPDASGIACKQGYMMPNPDITLRIRTLGRQGYMTLKSPSKHITRKEIELEIPFPEACLLLERVCIKPLIEKTRFRIPFHGHLWEVDAFKGANEGLIIAEIELQQEDETFVLPPWAGPEVSGDSRYFNAYLVTHPYSTWQSPVA